MIEHLTEGGTSMPTHLQHLPLLTTALATIVLFTPPLVCLVTLWRDARRPLPLAIPARSAADMSEGRRA